jgi:hypothetical protein
MEKLTFFIIFLGLCVVQNSFSQAPVSFPDGITVGTSAVAIPSGSTYKMAVGGGIITEKVRIATNGTTAWADYVFEPNYKLRSLSEVAQYIKINKHLPDVPSIAEVQASGIDLAQTQVMLLQKVEELTLYVIEQQREIERLKKSSKRTIKRKE